MKKKKKNVATIEHCYNQAWQEGVLYTTADMAALLGQQFFGKPFRRQGYGKGHPASSVRISHINKQTGSF